MKVDGNQQRLRRPIAEYIRHYMRYYGLTEYVDPFCGFCNVYAALYENRKVADVKDYKFYLSDLNPFTIAILERLWGGNDIADTLDRDRYHKIVSTFMVRHKAGGGVYDHLDGFEDWEVGCAMILGTLHQNPYKGWIGDLQYSKNINELKTLISSVPKPTSLICKDYYNEFFRSATGRMIYCDFPEPSNNNYFPFGMYFDKNEFFDTVRPTENHENIIIYSSKYFPDKGDYKIIFTSGEEKVYIAKKWYVEDILHEASGYSQKRLGPIGTIQERKRTRGRKKVP